MTVSELMNNIANRMVSKLILRDGICIFNPVLLSYSYDFTMKEHIYTLCSEDGSIHVVFESNIEDVELHCDLLNYVRLLLSDNVLESFVIRFVVRTKNGCYRIHEAEAVIKNLVYYNNCYTVVFDGCASIPINNILTLKHIN